MTKTEVFQSVDSVIPQKPTLEDFWSVEAIGITDNPSECDDENAKEQFKESITFEEGRYQVTWPWKEEVPELPVNKELALGRLKSCVKKLKNNPALLKKYNSVIQEQLVNGVIEKVQQSQSSDMKHYLPHHAVINPQKTTTKVRVVYDASAKSRSTNNSLNECLLRGPVMLQNLCGLLMRFRLHKVALVADIEKAFLQIGLQPSQRDVTRFLWLKDYEVPNVSQNNIQEYRFCRVPFGVIASPFLLGATVEHHLEQSNTAAAATLKDDIYVDNVITGTESVSEAFQLYQCSKSVFQKASMNLREWLSNSDTINQMIPEHDRAKSETMSVLGHSWNSRDDLLSIQPSSRITVDAKVVTKRNILKVVASVFDPLGLVTPVLLRGKLLLQTIWS